jgi:hypothetical protein
MIAARRNRREDRRMVSKNKTRWNKGKVYQSLRDSKSSQQPTSRDWLRGRLN